MKDKIKDIFSRYPALTATAVIILLGAIIYIATRHDETPEVEISEDAQVDTLALNIICSPTFESLPLYYAKEQGYCDSIGLPLNIRTENSQFNIDSLIRRTKRYDGAVIDSYRQEEYRKKKSSLAVETLISLDGNWRLLTSAKLRLREVAKLKKRTVAASRYSVSYNILEESLKSAKLKTNDVYLAQINDYSLRSAMLDNAQIEAAVLPEPYATVARLKGNRVVSSSDSVKALSLCFRQKSMKNKRKIAQIDLLKTAYNQAVKELNARGARAADSTLIKHYAFPAELIDSITLPHYRIAK